MIEIDARSGELIGDALCHVPYMDWLTRQHGTYANVIGLNRKVASLLAPSYPFIFDGPSEGGTPIFRMSIQDAFGYSNQCHAAQAFFRQYHIPEPELPLTLDLREAPSGLSPGVVISPYSRSNSPDDNKRWLPSRWVETIQTLRGEGLIDQVYVLGDSRYDDPSPYIRNGIEPIFDFSLAQVLHLMRQAPLVMTIDNGMSHLAHFGGIDRHVLLYPGCLPQCWVRNPRATLVTASMPIHVQSADMVRAARQALGA